MRRGFILLICILLVSVSRGGSAASLVEIPFTFSSSLFGIYSSVIIKTQYLPQESVWPDEKGLFEDNILYPSDQGKRIVVRSQKEDPEYNAYISLLTDSNDDQILIEADVGGDLMDITFMESEVFGDIIEWHESHKNEVKTLGLKLDTISMSLSVIYIGFPIFLTDIYISGKLLINPVTTIPSDISLLLLQSK